MGVEAIGERGHFYLEGSKSPQLQPIGDTFSHDDHIYAAKQPGTGLHRRHLIFLQFLTEMNGSGGTPKLLPLTLALSVLIWIIATSGGNHVLVREWLGEAYDSHAEHFLRGDVGVDAGAISSEAMIVNGKVRMYFGPFPAFVRIPLNFIYPLGRGRWSRVSGFLAGTIGLFAFSGLIA